MRHICISLVLISYIALGESQFNLIFANTNNNNNNNNYYNKNDPRRAASTVNLARSANGGRTQVVRSNVPSVVVPRNSAAPAGNANRSVRRVAENSRKVQQHQPQTQSRSSSNGNAAHRTATSTQNVRVTNAKMRAQAQAQAKKSPTTQQHSQPKVVHSSNRNDGHKTRPQATPIKNSQTHAGRGNGNNNKNRGSVDPHKGLLFTSNQHQAPVTLSNAQSGDRYWPQANAHTTNGWNNEYVQNVNSNPRPSTVSNSNTGWNIGNTVPNSASAIYANVNGNSNYPQNIGWNTGIVQPAVNQNNGWNAGTTAIYSNQNQQNNNWNTGLTTSSIPVQNNNWNGPTQQTVSQNYAPGLLANNEWNTASLPQYPVSQVNNDWQSGLSQLEIVQQNAGIPAGWNTQTSVLNPQVASWQGASNNNGNNYQYPFDVPQPYGGYLDYTGINPNDFAYAPHAPNDNRYRDFASVFNDDDRKVEPNDTDEDDDMNDDFNGRSIVAPGKYPHMAAIGFQTASKKNHDIIYKCGGSLISDQFVLTAAHCCSFNGQPPSIVKIGDIKLKEEDPDTDPQRRRVDKIFIHPFYNRSRHYNDIALIRLHKPVEYSSFVRPIRLWASEKIPYSKLFTMGYGSTSFAQAPTNILTELDLSIVPLSECNRTMPKDVRAPYGIVDSQICAKDYLRNRDTCQGDSGGPLQLNLERRKRKNKLRYYLVGITSYGAICRSSYPGVYTRVSYYIDWIASIVWPNYFKNSH